jgi:glycosyltransferase involved in cell wall biosynthesis
MSEAVIKLLEDDELRVKIGEAARKTIEKSYTWNRIADNILECYESILHK